NNLNKNISVLRQVLGEKPGAHRFIVTVPGSGYKFVADVRRVDDLETSVIIGENPSRVVEEPLEAKSSVGRSGSNGRRAIIAIGGIALIGIVLTAVYWRTRSTGTVGDPNETITSVAVLPFKPLVADDRNEALELGMADSLISKLSGGEITVRPITSVRRFVDLEQDSVAAGRDLGVQAVLEGSIQNVAGQVRISARLIRTSDGKQLWTGQFDEKSADIFAVQDSISEKVVTALSLKLSTSDRARLTKRYTQNVEAYDLYLKGRFHQLKLTLPEAKQAAEFYDRAIQVDPSYALAFAGLADVYRSFALTSDFPANETMPKAKAAAERAIAIDDSLAEAHAALGFVIFFYDWNWREAEQEYLRGIELNPGSGDTRQAYAVLLSSQGRHADAIAQIQLARKLDPLSQVSAAFEGFILVKSGKTDDAISTLTKNIDTEPNFWLTHLFLSSAYIEKNMFAEAASEAGRSKELSAISSQSSAYLAFALARSGNRPEAEAALNQLLKLSEERYVPPHNIALIYNALGETEKAIDLLDRGFAERDARMVFLKVEPQWKNLRDEPRFQNILQRMNL
ncbi:MAG: hypothetical protein ABI878_14150, partial [Acidobacteriota bacterium]